MPEVRAAHVSPNGALEERIALVSDAFSSTFGTVKSLPDTLLAILSGANSAPLAAEWGWPAIVALCSLASLVGVTLAPNRLLGSLAGRPVVLTVLGAALPALVLLSMRFLGPASLVHLISFELVVALTLCGVLIALRQYAMKPNGITNGHSDSQGEGCLLGLTDLLLIGAAALGFSAFLSGLGVGEDLKLAFEVGVGILIATLGFVHMVACRRQIVASLTHRSPAKENSAASGGSRFGAAAFVLAGFFFFSLLFLVYLMAITGGVWSFLRPMVVAISAVSIFIVLRLVVRLLFRISNALSESDKLASSWRILFYIVGLLFGLYVVVLEYALIFVPEGLPLVDNRSWSLIDAYILDPAIVLLILPFLVIVSVQATSRPRVLLPCLLLLTAIVWIADIDGATRIGAIWKSAAILCITGSLVAVVKGSFDLVVIRGRGASQGAITSGTRIRFAQAILILPVVLGAYLMVADLLGFSGALDLIFRATEWEESTHTDTAVVAAQTASAQGESAVADTIWGTLSDIALGIGIAVLVPFFLVLLFPIVRPVARSLAKVTLLAYEKTRETVAEIGETIDDLVAEVQAELREERLPEDMGYDTTVDDLTAEIREEMRSDRGSEGMDYGTPVRPSEIESDNKSAATSNKRHRRRIDAFQRELETLSSEEIRERLRRNRIRSPERREIAEDILRSRESHPGR